MRIKPLRPDLKRLLKKQNLAKKFNKQKSFFEKDPQHPSLNTEKLQPKNLNIYSFRLDKKWRVIFVVVESQAVEIVDINPHHHD